MSRVLTSFFILASSLISLPVAAELRDPTRPSGYVQNESFSDEEAFVSDNLQLQAIFFNPGSPAALINGKRYAVGEQMGDSRVKSIYADRVILIGQDAEIELRLALPSVKKRHGVKPVEFSEGQN